MKSEGKSGLIGHIVQVTENFIVTAEQEIDGTLSLSLSRPGEEDFPLLWVDVTDVKE
jgi:hypothetical protein